MLNSLNSVTSAAVAFIMLVSPQFMETHGSKYPEAAKVAAAARHEAVRIIKTGDTSALQELGRAVDGLVIPQKNMDEISPLLRELEIDADGYVDADPFIK